MNFEPCTGKLKAPLFAICEIESREIPQDMIII